MSWFLRLVQGLGAAPRGGWDVSTQSDALKRHLEQAELLQAKQIVRVEQLGFEVEQCERERAELAAALESTDRDVDLALSQGHDDLARRLLGKLLEQTRALERLVAHRNEQRALHEQAQKLRDAQSERLVSLRHRSRTLLRSAARQPAMHHPEPIPEEELELELLRRRRSAPIAEPLPSGDNHG